jgi:hypothetical protein
VDVATRFYDLRRWELISPQYPVLYCKAGILGSSWTGTVKSSSGSVIKSVTGSGFVDFAWDGTNGSSQVTDGEYSLEISTPLAATRRKSLKSLNACRFLGLLDDIGESDPQWFYYHAEHVRTKMGTQFINPLVLIGKYGASGEGNWGPRALKRVRQLLTQVRGFYFYGHGLGTARSFTWDSAEFWIDPQPPVDTQDTEFYIPSIVPYSQIKFVYLNACSLGCNHNGLNPEPNGWSLKWSDAFRQNPDEDIFIAWNGLTEACAMRFFTLPSYTYYWNERFLTRLAASWPIDSAYIDAVFGTYPNNIPMIDPGSPWRFIARNGWKSLAEIGN